MRHTDANQPSWIRRPTTVQVITFVIEATPQRDSIAEPRRLQPNRNPGLSKGPGPSASGLAFRAAGIRVRCGPGLRDLSRAGLHHSLVEGTGFEPMVPRKAPSIVVVLVSFAPAFPVSGYSRRGDISPPRN